MSVLIKGMEKPKDCYQCRLHYGHGECGVSIDGNCPLIELPDHGDLIDRDAIIEKAHELPNGFNHGYFHKCVDELFDYAPVVIPAERSE